jgi:hypothetical protein
MQRSLREQSRTSRTNPFEPEAKSLSSQPPLKIPKPITTALATNYTISDDRSNSSRYAYNLLLALQHQSRGTLFASLEPQATISAGTGTRLGEHRPDQSPSSVRQHTEETTLPHHSDLHLSESAGLETLDTSDLAGIHRTNRIIWVSVLKVPFSLGYYQCKPR